MKKKQSRKECLPTPEDLGSRWKTPKRRDLQKEILKWGLGGVEPGFQSHRWIAFTCAPTADPVLASHDQSMVQAMTQRFPYITSKHIPLPIFKSVHTDHFSLIRKPFFFITKKKNEKRNLLPFGGCSVSIVCWRLSSICSGWEN